MDRPLDADFEGITGSERELAEYLRSVVEEAGRIALRARAEGIGGQRAKSPGEWVSDIDLRIEELIRARLERDTPAHRFLAEETAPTLDDTERTAHPLWILDPIDGTSNFCRGLPHFAISLALAEKGRVRAGIVAAPALGEELLSIRGHGCFVNGARAALPDMGGLERVCAFGPAGVRRGVEALEVYRRRIAALLTRDVEIRRFGAAALDTAYVGLGRFDGFYELALKPWDIAAGTLFALEAGARVGTIQGELHDEIGVSDRFAADIVVAHPRQFEALTELLRSA